MARTPKTVEFPKDISDSIVALRNDGKKWPEISDAVNIPVGKCMLIWDHATVKPKDRIKNATGAQIAELRDGESLSWGVISARTGYPESSCRSFYEDATGKSTKGNRIGKGGRHPGDGSGAPAKPKGATKKGAAPKAEPAVDQLAGLDEDAVKERLTGFAIKVATDEGSSEIIKVKSVKKVTSKTVILTDSAGQGRTVKRAAIQTISAKKAVK